MAWQIFALYVHEEDRFSPSSPRVAKGRDDTFRFLSFVPLVTGCRHFSFGFFTSYFSSFILVATIFRWMIDDFISSILNKKINNKIFYVHFQNCSNFLLTIERDFFNSILIYLIFIDFIIILFLLFFLFILLLVASMNDR